MVPEIRRANLAPFADPGWRLLTGEESGNQRQTDPSVGPSQQKTYEPPVMADDIPPSISIAAVIMPSLDSKHLTPKAYHKGRIQCGHQIPFEEKSSCQMVQEKMIDFCAKQFQVPRTLTEKTAPSAHMPSKQRARGCHASETLPVGQANRQPQKTKKILEPARIETVSKNFQKRYNLNWEEVHGHASLWFLAEFKRGIALLPILFKPFQSLKHVLQKSS
jgi:hypothetical protein